VEARPPIEDRLRDAGLPPLPRTAWLEIDLDALTTNLAAIRRAVGSGVRVEPVVKADAYGHGLVPVARYLERAGADGLSVATLDEALSLREEGIEAPLLVLYPVPPELAVTAAERRIAVTVGDVVLLRHLLDSIADRGDGPELHIQIELETGLGRGGFAADDAVQAARAAREAVGVVIDGAWSHLAAAVDTERSTGQRERYDAAVSLLADEGIGIPSRHLSASGGLIAGSAPAYDAVRPGLAAYGIVPDDLLTDPATGLAADLRPVMSLHARPVRVTDLPPGWGISYGPSFTTARQSRIATLPLGYGDGWPRALSNKATAIVRGTRVPLVGTVAMDAVMADVTDVPGDPVRVDDEFTLLGRQGAESIDVGELARLRTTISWEVTTGMARRLPRVYHAAAGPVGLRTLTAAEDRWLGSNSGTATSAT
jgi:alanine racemase